MFLSVFFLYVAEMPYRKFREMLQVVADFFDFVFYPFELVFHGFGVELGYLPDRLLDELEDVVHHDFLFQESLIFLHFGEDFVQLGFP